MRTKMIVKFITINELKRLRARVLEGSRDGKKVVGQVGWDGSLEWKIWNLIPISMRTLGRLES
jgi:hypothetical protein